MKFKILSIFFLIILLTACSNNEEIQKEASQNINSSSQIETPLEADDYENPFSFDYLELEGSDILTGEEIDSSIFQNSKITMVNVWATFCQPCVEEMPEIVKLNKESTGDYQTLGIAIDTLYGSMENQVKAKEILQSSEAKFLNITPTIEFAQSHYQDFQSVPTTFFVDNEGKVIGPVRLGAGSYKDYKNLIEQTLLSIEK